MLPWIPNGPNTRLKPVGRNPSISRPEYPCANPSPLLFCLCSLHIAWETNKGPPTLLINK